jgi:hypothetical protein
MVLYDVVTTLICYVPEYVILEKSFKLTSFHKKQYSFLDKFTGEYAVKLSETDVKEHVPMMHGACCLKCQTFVQLAPELFTCYDCRIDPWR